MLTQLDLLLASLSADERQVVWKILLNFFVRRSKALIFAIPQRAVGIIITEPEIQAWQNKDRLASNHSSTIIWKGSLMSTIGELVQLDAEAAFRSDVQLDAYDKPHNRGLAAQLFIY